LGKIENDYVTLSDYLKFMHTPYLFLTIKPHHSIAIEKERKKRKEGQNG